MPNLPSEFKAAMKKQLGEQYDAFEESLQQTVPTSVRVNALKNAQHHLDFDKKAKIGWHTEGYYLTERPVFTLDPAFHGGAYYVQEAGSMFIAEALTQVLDLEKDHTVLRWRYRSPALPRAGPSNELLQRSAQGRFGRSYDGTEGAPKRAPLRGGRRQNPCGRRVHSCPNIVPAVGRCCGISGS